MIPFFVVDRPNGLELLRRAFETSKRQIGIMTHVRVSSRFVSEIQYWKSCSISDSITVPYVMADSGTFGKNNTPLRESDLLDCYEKMGVDFGIVNDVLGNRHQSVVNSKQALREYYKKHRTFSLVAVAQGHNLDEYLECYRELANIGYKHIAIGGLIQKKEKSVRFTQLKSQELMRSVILAIRQEFNPSWLYVLGAYNPRRHCLFRELKVWGSDYKGWLLRYPTIFQGFIILSKLVHKRSLPHHNIRAIKRAGELILGYRSLDRYDRNLVKEFVESLHLELWRSELVYSLLYDKSIESKDRQILRSVFYQRPERRRQLGILKHLKKEILPLLLDT